MHPHVPSRSSDAYYALYLYIYIHILNFPILPETQIRYLPNSQKNLKSEIDGKPRLRITLSLSRSFITMLLEEKRTISWVFPENVLMYGNGNPKPDDLLLESLSWLLASKRRIDGLCPGELLPLTKAKIFRGGKWHNPIRNKKLHCIYRILIYPSSYTHTHAHHFFYFLSWRLFYRILKEHFF